MNYIKKKEDFLEDLKSNGLSDFDKVFKSADLSLQVASDMRCLANAFYTICNNDMGDQLCELATILDISSEFARDGFGGYISQG
jgi:hypothetical protein